MTQDQFQYPWGHDWKGVLRPRGKAKYKTRRMTVNDRKMLNRITGKRLNGSRLRDRDLLGIHSEQPTLWSRS